MTETNKGPIGLVTEIDYSRISEKYHEIIMNSKPYPYGEASVRKDGFTTYRATRVKLPQVSLEELGTTARTTNGKSTVDDLRSFRFGDLVVIEFAGWYVAPKSGWRYPRWTCLCLLTGRLCEVTAGVLKTGTATASRTAAQRKAVAAVQGVSYLNALMDGRSKRPEYTIWCGIKRRCHNPLSKAYPLYGGRGVLMCERWAEAATGFTAFMEDVGTRPTPDSELDRIDVNGHYHPGNTRWYPKRLQPLNTRSSLPRFEIRNLLDDAARSGVHLTNVEVADIIGCTDSAVSYLRRSQAFFEFTDDGLNLFPKPCRPDLEEEHAALPPARPESLSNDAIEDVREAAFCEGFRGKELDRIVKRRLKKLAA